MHKTLLPLAALLLTAPLLAQDAKPVPSPGEIVAAAPKGEWVAISASDLLVMDLASDAKSKPRRVVIQLMPPPFSQGWIGNIRKLAASRFWDGTAINRVQDNYVVQWGDPDAEEKAKARVLPSSLSAMQQTDYVAPFSSIQAIHKSKLPKANAENFVVGIDGNSKSRFFPHPQSKDAYAPQTAFLAGWPLALGKVNQSRVEAWPVHCYGMVGVGRDMPPNTGTGAELYVVIGHAPRHLDRNIALVGRVIEGIEHLSSLPRGKGALGFYDLAQGDERVPIVSIRLASDLPSDKPFPSYEYLSTESPSFAAYADARANRRDAFFIRPAGGADICNIPVPVRRVAAAR